MKKLKRILSTIWILVLFLNMIPQVKAAEGDAEKLTMTASEAAVDHGDMVTVTIAANRSFVTRGAGMTVAYDPEALQPVLESSTAKEGFQIHGPLTVNGKTILRISSFPGEEGRTVEVDEPLAVLAFRTLTPGDNIQVEMTAAYLYDEALNQINLQTAEPVQLSVIPVAVTGITLEMETLDLEIGETRTLKASIQPENASDKTVSWTTSDETKVTVSNGILTGLAITEEPVTITASAGDFTAECTVNVVYPPDAGYILAMPADKTAVAKDTITIAPVIDNAKEVSVYNAYDITIAYDPEMLTLVNPEIADATVTMGNGTVNVIRYGEDLNVDSAPFTLSFTAQKTGETTVSVRSARIDHSENAVISNAAKATLIPGETKFTIGGYPVSLPDDFSGAAVVEPESDYTFEAKDKFYDYTFDGSTMGSQSVTVKDNGDGTYTIDKITGNLVIQARKQGKIFEVQLGTDMTGNSTAQYMTDYSATLQEDDDYTYSVHITIGGNYYTGFSKSGSTYTIPGKDITGKIIFTVTKTAAGTPPPSTTWYDVTFEGSGAGAVTGHTASVAAGSSYRFTLNKEAGYRYSVTYKMGTGEEEVVRPDENGNYSIPKVSGDLIITVTKELEEMDYSIEVYNYITLNDGKTMYLVMISGGLDDSKIFTYGESPMYFSEVYNAWCILTVESSKLTAGLAQKQIGDKKGQMDVISSAAFDVNMTGLVDINDAQLVYDMYNGKYDDFTTINMHRFLNADGNADKKITVTDAAAVVSAIK